MACSYSATLAWNPTAVDTEQRSANVGIFVGIDGMKP
jgi:hypothetical protein